MENVTKYVFERIKSTDFPLECRAMYYFAKGRHDHQVRKVTGMPYYIHPRGVAYIVMAAGGTHDQINAAFGHDLLEDTETSFAEISIIGGYHCAELCSELRNNKYTIDDVGKETYMSENLVEMSDDALLVKLADILYNILDSPTLPAKERMHINVEYLLVNRQNIPEKCLELIDIIKKS
jgi:GTP pyrophosphokinase